MVATTLLALFLLSRRVHIARGNLFVLFGAGVAIAAADYVSNADAHYNFGAMFGGDVPVVSAADASGFKAVAGTNGRNVVLVIVESLGNMLDANARARIVAPIYDSRITEKYDVSYGRIVYYGSTTSAEMRELCETRAPYAEFTKTSGSSCLPERLQMRGYTTTAVHGFYSGMFDRNQWYPRVGFEKMEFGEALMPQIQAQCGKAFRGVCDADLPPLIERVAARDQKAGLHLLADAQHAYSGGARRSADQIRLRARRTTGSACTGSAAWPSCGTTCSGRSRSSRSTPAIAPAEILVVGDHAPPLWSKKGRAEFEAGKVPWYRLTPRDGVIASNARDGKDSATAH